VADGLLPHIPQRGNVVSETLDVETGAIIWELSNGARIILQSTENRNDEIVLHALARGGTSSVADADSVSASLATEMRQISGLGPWTHPELTRMLAARQVSLSHSIGSYTRGFQGSSTTGDLRTFFEMLYLNFTYPRIDPEAVEVLMEWQRNSLALRGENPNTVFSDTVNRVLTGDHPRYRPMELADLPLADIDAALAFLQWGLNPADFTFVFVGNLTPEIMRGYIETYLASIPAGEEHLDNWTDLGIVRPGRVEEHIFVGMEEQSSVQMAWFAPAVFSEQLNMTTWILREYLNIRLNEEIRENLGGVYSIWAWTSVSAAPRGEMALRIGFACDPGRVEELSAAVINLLNGMADGIAQDVFNGAVESQLMSWEVFMQSNSSIAGSYANSAAMMNLPLSRLHRRPQYINAVSPADLQRIAAQLLENGPAKIVMFPGQ